MCSHNTPGSTALLAGGAWSGWGVQPSCTEHVPSEYQRLHPHVSYSRLVIHTKVQYPKNIDNQKRKTNANIILYCCNMSWVNVNIQKYENWYECNMKCNQNWKIEPLTRLRVGGGYSAVHIPAGPIAPIGTQWHVFYLPLSLNTISCVLKKKNCEYQLGPEFKYFGYIVQ